MTADAVVEHGGAPAAPATRVPGATTPGADPRQGSELIDSVSDAVLATDVDYVITYLNPAARQLYGLAARDMVGVPIHQVFRSTHPALSEGDMADQLARTGEFSGEVLQHLPDGSTREVATRVTYVRDAAGLPVGMVAVNRDLTVLRRAEAERASQERLARDVLDALSSPTCLLGPDGTITTVNAAWHAGWLPVDASVPRLRVGDNYLAPLEGLLSTGDDARRAAVAAVLEGVRAVLDRRVPDFRHDYRVVAPEGREPTRGGGPATSHLVISLHATPLHPPGAGAVVTHADVTHRSDLQSELARRATHDDLTGLPNRRLFDDRLAHAVSLSARHGTHLAVLFCDLDNFKDVNDALGHTAGDEVLVQVAQRIRRAVRGADTVARLGGDEFLVLAEDLSDVDEARLLAGRILATFEDPFVTSGGTVTLATSIGVSHIDPFARVPDDGRGVSALRESVTIEHDASRAVMDADHAMYAAKQAGRATVTVFDTAMRARLRDEAELLVDLRRALERGEFVLHFQPLRRCIDNRLVGHEALVRWNHPTRGMVPPGEFIALAEQHRLISAIGSWVLQEATRQAASWRTELGTSLTIAVNVSPEQLLGTSFPDEVAAALQSTGLAARNLHLEITETALIDDPEKVRVTLNALHELGVQLSVDDFGTGYSSLTHLHQFPVNIVKLDRSFVSRIPGDTHALAIVTAMIRLADSLDLHVVGEGIETTEQLAALRSAGCHTWQGFHLDGRPVPPERVAERFATGH